jgi:enterochelin esterase-like enzyme
MPALETCPQVRGADVDTVQLRSADDRWRAIAWEELERTQLPAGSYELRIRAEGIARATAIEVPWCAGRTRITLDGRDVPAARGPFVVPIQPGPHDVDIALTVSAYEGRIACGDRPRVGTVARTAEGLGVLTFPSPHAAAGGGRAVVYVPPGHDSHSPAALLVGLHPWNGSMWTYAAYSSLVREAAAHDLVLLMPSGLGNSLYAAAAEDEVIRAIDAVSAVVAVLPRGVSIWGASMGGAGATTIAFHRPDRFATVTSFFGDSKYDVSSYVHGVLPTESAAHEVNALDVVDNARHLVVRLVHGEDDHTSLVRQSEMLATAMRARGFAVRFDRVPGVGHSGSLVTRYLPEVVAAAAVSRSEVSPSRVTYRSVRPRDTSAYGVRIVRSSSHDDAFVDIELLADAVHVRRAEAVRAIVLSPGALGATRGEPPAIVDDTHSVDARWESAR